MYWDDKIDEIKHRIIDLHESYEFVGRDFNCTGTTIKNVLRKYGIRMQKRRKINISETFNKGKTIKSNIHIFCKNCGMEINDKSYHHRTFCSNKCQGEYRSKATVEEWKQNPEKFNNPSGYIFIREYLKKLHDNTCELCGWKEINIYTGLVPLQVHHINGDCTDNRFENLQLLCPNCHSLTENFGGRNKGNSKRK